MLYVHIIQETIQKLLQELRGVLYKEIGEPTPRQTKAVHQCFGHLLVLTRT
jgi:hypothetical protein